MACKTQPFPNLISPDRCCRVPVVVRVEHDWGGRRAWNRPDGSSWIFGLSSRSNHELFGVMNATAAPVVSTAMPNLPISGMSRGGVTTSPPKAAAFVAVPSQSGTAT